MKMRASRLPDFSQWAAMGLIGLYSILALEPVTMFRYIPLASLLCRLGRYGLYGLMALLWLYQWLQAHPGTLRQRGREMAVWLSSHLLLVSAGLCALLVYTACGSLLPAALILICMLAENLDKKKLFTVLFWIQLFCFAALIVCSLSGLIGNLSYPTYLRGTRYSLGYIFPLELHAHFFFLVLAAMVIWQKSYGFWMFAAITVLNVLLYQVSISRTAFLLAELIPLCALITKKLPGSLKDRLWAQPIWKYMAALLPIGFAGLSFVLALTYDPSNALLVWLNKILSDRLALGKQALETWPLLPFGQKIVWLGAGGPDGVMAWSDSYNFVDNSYIKDFLDYGYMWMILYYFGFVWLMLHWLKKKQGTCLWVGLGILMMGFMEPRLMAFPCNLFPVLMAAPLSRENAAIQSWFETRYPLHIHWSSRTFLQKGALAALLAAFLVAGGLESRHLRIVNARREFVSSIVSSRGQFVMDIETLPVPEGTDPVLFRELVLQAMEQSDAHFQTLLDTVDLRFINQMYLTQEEFQAVSNLKSQQTERQYKTVLQNAASCPQGVLETLLQDPDTLSQAVSACTAGTAG